MRSVRCWLAAAVLAGAPTVSLGQVAPVPGASPAAVVHAVLFYSPVCPHCHQVMTVDLPPLVQRYGSQLRIATVNTTSPGGQALYQATVERFAIPEDRLGVPTLVVGARVLVGSREIPDELPGIVDRGLAAGGIGWPDVPEIRRAVAQADSTEAVAADTAPIPSASDRAMETITPEAGAVKRAASGGLSAWGRFRLDPVGNGASVVVLLAMVAALALVALALAGRGVRIPVPPGWVVPALAAIGLGVAAYLAFVEVTGTRAVCGPVGDCNTVQQSEYARLFGVLPIGVLGMLGYVGMVGLWLVGRLGGDRAARAGRLGAWVLALLATVFSVYLTFLEPFVIGATCAWCLSSAVVVTLLLLVMTPAVRQDLADTSGP